MFDIDNEEEENNEDEGCRIMGSVAGLRDSVLELFGTFLAKTMDDEELVGIMEHQKQFLEVWEVESILKEHSDIAEDGCYGIGANSFEEYREKMGALFRELTTRIVSNVMQMGVKRGLVDAEYDFEKDAFAFSITEKGACMLRDGAPPESAEES